MMTLRAFVIAPFAALPVVILTLWFKGNVEFWSGSAPLSMAIASVFTVGRLVLPVGYAAELLVAWPAHVYLRQRQIASLAAYAAVGVAATAVACLLWATIEDYGPFGPSASRVLGYAAELLLLTLPSGLTAAATFWWLAVRPLR